MAIPDWPNEILRSGNAGCLTGLVCKIKKIRRNMKTYEKYRKIQKNMEKMKKYEKI
jgi:hypothetical protein